MSNSTNRIEAIDFGKGILVLLMVVYHAMNYLGYDSLPHDYLAFLPASFIMIAGFLIMQVYAKNNEYEFARIGTRLGIRAVKLLLIFTVLNLAARSIWSRNQFGFAMIVGEFASSWFDVYVTGDAKNIAFAVLAPISYTLLVSIVILVFRGERPDFLKAFAAGIVLVCVFLEIDGHSVNNLALISAGVIGLSVGTIQLSAIERAATSWKCQAVPISIYLAIVLFKLDNYASQMVVTLMSLFVLYSIGRTFSSDRRWFGQVCLLGRYSLMSYIVQIVLLQWTPIIGRFGLAESVARAPIVVFLVAGLMWVIVRFVDWGRSRAIGVDRLYRSVFA